MRPRFKPPLNKRYFHSKRKFDNKDMFGTKKRIENIKQKNIKKLQKDKKFRI
jgi:hypothetical protein